MGLNDSIKGVCTQRAEAGFVAFAPDLYQGEAAFVIAAAEPQSSALDANHLEAKGEIADAARFLGERVAPASGGLAVLGFSLCAYYALDLAATDPEHVCTVVPFYGTGGDDFSNSRAAYLGQFAEPGPFKSPAQADEL